MRPRTRKRTLLFTFLLLTVLIGLAVWSMYRQVRQERLNRDLIAAVKKNNTAMAVALLNAGANPNAQDKGDASVSARQVMMNWFNRLRGRKSTKKIFYRSALTIAWDIRDRDVWATPPEHAALVTDLLERGADPNVRDEHGHTPLIWSVWYVHPTGLTKLLLDRGADVNAQDNDGKTALQYAAQYRHSFPIKLLLAHGADVTIKDKYGDTALKLALGDDEDIVLLLQQHGAKE
jgi:ankyrin repeat protein